MGHEVTTPEPKPKPQNEKLRPARQSDRDYAAELVRLFRSQEPIERMRLIANGRIVRERGPVDAEHLASALEIFAIRGTFDPPPGDEQRAQTIYAHRRDDRIRARYSAMLKAGSTSAKAVAQFITEGHSKNVVENAIWPRKKSRKK